MAKRSASRKVVSQDGDGSSRKVTLRLDGDLATRLAVVSAMTRRTQSSLASEALCGFLAKCRGGSVNLPSRVPEGHGADPGGHHGDGNGTDRPSPSE